MELETVLILFKSYLVIIGVYTYVDRFKTAGRGRDPLRAGPDRT